MQKLVEGLHKFQSEFAEHRDLFMQLSKGQNPEVLFITCSDSRVNPNLITQTAPGDLFILRNAGNIIPPYGTAASGEAATIEFAIAELGIRHVIVCGHTLCGAMRALVAPELPQDLPAVRTWLQQAESTRRLIKENYGHLEGDALNTATAEENVLAQIENLRTHPTVRSRIARRELSLYAWVYKIETGDIFQYTPETGQFSTLRESIPVPATAIHRTAI
jgi:carbonic anhydrase